ncbi:MAG: ATP-dependent Clp protease ATP-binding subunit [Patescibacteria group bacterium]
MPNRLNSENWIFYEPRLEMTLVGRFLVRLCSYVTYAGLSVTSIIFLLNDLRSLKAIGALLILFLLDRLRVANRADRSLDRASGGKINLAHYLSPKSYAVIEWALDRAIFSKSDFELYLLKKLTDRSEIQEGLTRVDVKPEEFRGAVEKEISIYSGGVVNRKEISIRLMSLVKIAASAAIDAGGSRIDPKDLLLALVLFGDSEAGKIFKKFDLSADSLFNSLITSQFRSTFARLSRMPSSLVGLLAQPRRARRRVMNRAWTARPTPLLDQFSRDITDLARSESVGFLIGHHKEYDRLVDVLSRPGRPNVLLVGEAGSGKSTLVAHLAFEIVKDRVPAPLFDKRLVELEIGGLVSGVNEDELEVRVNRVINEIAAAGNLILYIPDIHNLFRTSGQGRISAADVLLPAIKSDAFSVIGATSPREFKQYVEPNSDFGSSFESVRVEEISENDAVKLLSFESVLLERQFRAVISFSALREAVNLAKKYFHQKLLPGSAEDLLRESLADAVGRKKKILTADDVIAVAEKKVNIPIHKAGKEEAAKLLNLEAEIHQRFIDQEEAVGSVARALREYRSGLSRKGGPIATFLFVGPTGVGKTELSKILAKIQFGSSEAMTRLDMSEYQDKSSIHRLLGMPDGSATGNLIAAVTEKPYSLILLDEFEKAHPDILNIFLQVFDDGRLTDNLGRTVDFQNTIIIATSNAHSNFIQSEIAAGASVEKISEQIKKKLTEYFRPELLNRFSDVVVFKPLSPEHIKAVAKIQLAGLAATLMENQGIEMSFSDSAVSEIARVGFDPSFGARPLRNAISEKIKAGLSERILKGEVKKGDTIKVVYDQGLFKYLNV